MDDLEITKACAEAMGLETRANKVIHRTISGHPFPVKYDPLHDDAQAMGLLKKFELTACRQTWSDGAVWFAEARNARTVGSDKKSLNRAICECVANMQKAKHD